MQNSATVFAPVSKYRFGARVFTSDGEEGSLDSLIVDADAHAITGMRVRFGLFGRELYSLPMAVIRHANPDRVELHATLDDLKRQYSQVAAVMLLTSRTQVMVGGKSVGKLIQVTVNRETQALRHLVVRGLRGESLVSARGITAIEGRKIIIGAGSENAAFALTLYRPDEEIREEVREAIYNYAQLRVDLPGIAVRVIDGVLWLQGHVSSDLNKRLVRDQIVNVRGLNEIHNDLIADNDLASDVAMALAKDPRTKQSQIGVYPSLGHVNLRGSVRTPAARQAAYEVARSVPGVEDVENALVVDPDAEVIPVLAGVTNQEDRVPGGR